MDSERKAKLESLEWWQWNPHDDAWSAKFHELVAFYEANGRFPLANSPCGLGTWVDSQRSARATMSEERRERLEALEWWVWSVRAAPVRRGWDARFDELVAYHAEHGRIPPQNTPGGLGQWASDQRQRRATMDAARTARLDALGWWAWNKREDAWSARFDELVAYHAEHGRIPPQNTSGGLGQWVTEQRQHRATMDAARKAKLESLGWWVWNSRVDAWSARLNELVEFYEAHATLPPALTPGGLGSWVHIQRRDRDTLDPERKRRLDALGWWVWGVRVEWDIRLDELVAYHAEHGRQPPSTSGLGAWVGKQRQAREAMDATRKARLEALDWWVWDPLEEAWSARFRELVAYHAEHGRLPTQSEPGIGQWVNKQRMAREAMDSHRKERLDALEWWVWSGFKN
jgi:hypothetical protein